MINVYDLLTT